MPRSLLARLSQLPIRLLVFILREEYFQTPPGGASRARLIIIICLQELQTRQEAMSTVIAPALHDPTLIVPASHDPAGVVMIATRPSLSRRNKRLGNPEQLRVSNGQSHLLIDIETLLPRLAGKAQLVPQSFRHSVLELILPRVQYRLRVLTHHFHTLCRLHPVPSNMRLDLRAMTETTMTTTTLLADDLEDP